MDAARGEIVSCLEEIFQPKGILARNDAAVRAKEQLPLETLVVSGEVPETVAVHMNGLRLQADLLHGQKTGIFLDQRENYRAAARYAAGGKALDCFTSTGGFALHLASQVRVGRGGGQLCARAGHGARECRGERHRQRGISRGRCLRPAGRHTRRRGGNSRWWCSTRRPSPNRGGSIDGAVRGYKEINLRALRLLGPGGVLVTCSCSHHISEAMLLELVAEAALDANRTLRVLERRTQSQDHPILLTVPETLYLKCLILQVV